MQRESNAFHVYHMWSPLKSSTVLTRTAMKPKHCIFENPILKLEEAAKHRIVVLEGWGNHAQCYFC